MDPTTPATRSAAKAPGGAPPVITTTGLGMDFGRVVALHDLTLQVGPGVTGLVGANGAGKSTLLKILLGLQEPTSGSATVLGHDVASESHRIRGLVGYMPEHDCLPPDVTASDFVVHLARMSGLPQAPARERTADILRIVGLAEERYRLLGGYSTGMKQRAKLAQALVHDPSLVLLDEPTNGLDPASRHEMLELVRRVGHDFDIPVLVTSHLLGELEKVSDHVVVLDGGVLLRASATSQFLDATGALLVEVLGGVTERDRLGEALAAAGLTCRPQQRSVRVEPPAAGVDVHRVVRDAVDDLGLGLLRVQADHGHLEDVFTSPSPGARPPGPPLAPPTPPGGPRG